MTMIKLYRPSQVRELPLHTSVGSMLNGALDCLEQHVAKRCPATPMALDNDAIHMTLLNESDPEALHQLLLGFLPTFQRLFPRENGTYNAVLFALPGFPDREPLHDVRQRLSNEGYLGAGLAFGLFELKFTASTGVIAVSHKVWTLVVRHIVETDLPMLLRQMTENLGPGIHAGIFPVLNKLLELYPDALNKLK